MNPGFPRPSGADENALRGAFSLTPPAVPDHTLLQLIGRGSYGDVWLACNVIGTQRAVKIVHRRAFENDRPYEREFMGIQRFEPVSRTHEGLVDILQVGRDEDAGHFYYVMELADDANAECGVRNAEQTSTLAPGPRSASPAPCSYLPRTLAHEIDRRGALPVDECISLALSLVSAVAHLHKQGLIHRDIKPANIIFVGGVPKLADIGLVSEAGSSESYVGTEGYIPPEGPGTRQADLYSLGKVIYEASTGRDRVDFPAIPVALTREAEGKRFLELNAIMVKACARDARHRYASAEELQADLALLQIGKSVRRLHTMERRLRVMTRVGAAAAVAAALAFGAYGFAKRQARLDRENYLRIERAEKEARTQLHQALFSQAKVLRRSGESGQRFESLAALAKAAAIQPSLELRNEVVACLTRVDLRLMKLPPLLASGKVDPVLDANFERYAIPGHRTAQIEIRRVADDELLMKLPAGAGAVNGIHGFSPDGQRLFVGYGHNETVLWDLGRQQKMLTLERGRPLSTSFSADGRRLAAAYTNGTIAVCDLAAGNFVKDLVPDSPARAVRLSRDGTKLGILSRLSHQVDVVEVETGQRLSSLPHPEPVRDLAWDPQRERLATACGQRLFFWNLPVTEPTRVVSAHEGGIWFIGFDSTGEMLASTSGWDGMTRLWDTATGAELVKVPVPSNLVQFNRDGTRFRLHWNVEPRIWLYELSANRVCRLLQAPRAEIRQADRPWHGAFSSDGRWFTSAGHDGVRIWARRGLEVAHVLDRSTFSVAVHPNGRQVVTSGEGGLVRWSVNSGSNNQGFTLTAPQTLDPTSNCRRACGDASGERLAYIRGDEVRVLKPERAFALKNPWTLALSPDGQWLAASSWPVNDTRLWRVEDDKEVFAYRDPSKGPVEVAFTPDSRWLIIGGGEAFTFRDVRSGQPGRQIARRNAVPYSGAMAFSQDGKLLAAVVSRTEIQLLDVESLSELVTFESPSPQMIFWLTFDPTGRHLAAGGEKHLIELWDLGVMRRELAELKLNW